MRRLGITCLLILLPCLTSAPAPGQGVPRTKAETPFYVLPLWHSYLSADEDTVAHEVQELRRRLGPESARVRLGFTTYIGLSMEDWNVDPSDGAAIRRALAKNIAEIDTAIDRARRHNIALCLSLVTAIRERYDPVQKASEIEDRRNTQWLADNSLAGGWWTHSRYARKQRRVQEAYMREIGRIVANRMARYPETLVAASGDGEVELAYDKTPIVNPAYTVETMLLADYSPFAVAEFRDWISGRGQYKAGGPFAADAYEHAARYAGDDSPARDTNHDGHTLNGDFRTSFTTWTLRFFDWSLDDDPVHDPRAIPASVTERKGWNARPETQPGGFDPPRAWKQGNAWWEVWHKFRQLMIWRHNREVAEWVTTSRDSETNTVVPADRWYSDQIAADYLFGGTPDHPNLRFITSASAWWTADVTPRGRLGITAFNVNVNGTVFRTLAGVAPRIAELDVDWGILEWNPSAPATKEPAIYRSETRIVELYRPSLVVPIFWGDRQTSIVDSGFEVALREMVEAMSKGTTAPAIEATPARLNFGVTADGRVTPAQRLHVDVVGRGKIAWTATTSAPGVVLSGASGQGSARLDVSVAARGGTAADDRPSIIVRSAQSSTPEVRIPVLIRRINSAGAPPYGSLDGPAEGATVGTSFDVGGWALDDVGVTKVEVWREAGARNGASRSNLVKLGGATFHSGTRPDVTKMFADTPLSDRAGWTFAAALPARLAGPVRLHVLVTDVEGHVKDLGPRTVVVKR